MIIWLSISVRRAIKMPFNDDPRRNSVHAARALRDGEEICVVGLREEYAYSGLEPPYDAGSIDVQRRSHLITELLIEADFRNLD